MCGPIPLDLDQDIWQIIFELVVIYDIIIGDPQTPSNFELKERGGGWTFHHPVLRFEERLSTGLFFIPSLSLRLYKIDYLILIPAPARMFARVAFLIDA